MPAAKLSPSYRLPAACLCAALVLCGCKTTSAPTDASLTSTSQAQLAADSALAGQSVTASVNNGIANLNGSVANDAQKSIAARDVAGIPGIKEVNNNLMVGPAAATVSTPAPAPIPLAPVPLPPVRIAAKPEPVKPVRQQPQPAPYDNRQPAPIERPQQAYNPPAPVAPPPPPQPIFRNVTVPVGTTVPVRVTQTLDSASTQQGDTFSGVVASDVIIDGATVLAAGSTVTGQVDAVHEAAHFKGSSLLTVSLSRISRRGERLPVSSDPYSVQGKGRGANTAEKVGGGAAVGAIIGGIFGGGKGAAIGAGAGGGLGAGAQAVTKGQQVQIPSETIVRFHLAAPLSVRVRGDQNGGYRNGDGLQPRNE